MNNFPSQNSIIDAVLEGIQNAQDSFRFWTNQRLSLYYAPRKMLTMNIAQSIAKLSNPPEIFLDATIADILRCSLKDRKSYIEFMKKRDLEQSDFAITLDKRFEHKNHEDSISKVVISVRNLMINSRGEHLNKIEQLCKMLHRDEEYSYSSLDYGLFCFYSEISSNARKKLDKRIPQIIEKMENIVSLYPKLKSSYKILDIVDTKEGGQWSAGCFIIETT